MSFDVITGLVPVISIRWALCVHKRDGRDKPGDDTRRLCTSVSEARVGRGEYRFPSPLVGEGVERRSREAGEGDFRVAGTSPLTRFLAALETTLSHKGRGK